jgi:endonuclease/exonuclease/phosphatase family metal-dependent hydrolase
MGEAQTQAHAASVERSLTMQTFRVATYNIHKGVQGVGPARRLEIHNLGHAVEQFDADVVCLQEVRAFNRQQARRFKHWPEQGQAEFLAPEGYTAVYRTNAVTRHGEHGNALLSRWPVLAHQHHNISDHRFEQRGLLHVTVKVGTSQAPREVHVIVVHLGLLHASRVRQTHMLQDHIERAVPAHAPLLVAGDFNDWGHTVEKMMAAFELHSHRAQPVPTFPSRLPLVQLDHVYARGLTAVRSFTPRGPIWGRMSDHLPLLVDFAWGDAGGDA